MYLSSFTFKFRTSAAQYKYCHHHSAAFTLSYITQKPAVPGTHQASHVVDSQHRSSSLLPFPTSHQPATWSRHTPRSACKACLCSKLRCCTLHELFTMLHQIIAPLFVCTVPLLAFHKLPAVAQVTQQRAEAGGADRCL